ncbi:uncharacterized protein [Triticum aestivum]|uniref:uncharacterized protein n=1 Tax=Triticum aestivum TaxID=4565 RepID=UPI001D00E6BC|nr:uncharacterized protein LOC123093612 [Triticum aestivum]
MAFPNSRRSDPLPLPSPYHKTREEKREGNRSRLSRSGGDNGAPRPASAVVVELGWAAQSGRVGMRGRWDASPARAAPSERPQRRIHLQNHPPAATEGQGPSSGPCASSPWSCDTAAAASMEGSGSQPPT